VKRHGDLCITTGVTDMAVPNQLFGPVVSCWTKNDSPRILTFGLDGTSFYKDRSFIESLRTYSRSCA
jgi:hypothetical protein